MNMNTLLGKILLAMLVSTLLALLVVSGIQRSAFKRGLSDFLEQLEQQQLTYLIPELESWYQDNGSWDALRQQPRRWLQLLARTRPDGVGPPGMDTIEQRRPPRPERSLAREHVNQNHRDQVHGPAGPRPDELRQLWRRIYLLDADQHWVAGASGTIDSTDRNRAIEVDGVIVGWVGFNTAITAPRPEAHRFLQFQRNTMVVAAVVAIFVSGLLAFALARHLSRPVVALRDGVQRLTAGDFTVRIPTRKGGDEIAALGRHINRLAESLQAHQGSRQRWTADIAHELRTPIAILQAEIEAARDGVRPDLNTTLDSLQEEVRHLSALVNDLQTLALADAGALNLSMASTDVAALLRQTLGSLQDRIDRAGLSVELVAPQELYFTLDAQRIRQLMLNLLENACRYTDPGGTIRVLLVPQHGGLQIRVEDTAPGLNEAQISQLFDRFYRAENSRGRAGGGSGLGLSICREIVQSHGGEIQAGPSEMGGLAIVVQLPETL